MSRKEGGHRVDSPNSTFSLSEAEGAFLRNYERVDSGKVDKTFAESASSFLEAGYTQDGRIEYQTEIRIRKSREFTETERNSITSYQEAISDFDSSLKSRATDNDKNLTTYKLISVEEHGDDSVYQIFPDRYSSRNKLVSNTRRALESRGVHTKEELLKLDPDDFFVRRMYGEKTIRAISALQDAALADLRLRNIVNSETYNEIIEEQSRRILNPPSQKTEDVDSDTGTNDTKEEEPGKFQQDNVRPRYTRNREEPAKIELPQDHWGWQDLQRYERQVLSAPGSLREPEDYPATISLHPNTHSHLSTLRERGAQGQRIFSVRGYQEISGTPRRIWGQLDDDPKNYTFGNMAEIIRDLALSKNLRHVVEEAFPDVKGSFYRHFGHHLDIPDENDGIPLEQLHRFLTYRGRMRPLLTTFSKKNEYFMAFITSDTKPVDPNKLQRNRKLTNQGAAFSFNTQSVVPERYARSKYINLGDSGIESTAKVSNNHGLVVYRSGAKGELIKMRPESLIRK